MLRWVNAPFFCASPWPLELPEEEPPLELEPPDEEPEPDAVLDVLVELEPFGTSVGGVKGLGPVGGVLEPDLVGLLPSGTRRRKALL